MLHLRHGTSLCEVLLALVLLSATVSWALAAAAAAERALGNARAYRSALHRTERELADLSALPCDSTHTIHAVTERRWQLTAARRDLGEAHTDEVVLRSVRGDTIIARRSGWCD